MIVLKGKNNHTLDNLGGLVPVLLGSHCSEVRVLDSPLPQNPLRDCRTAAGQGPPVLWKDPSADGIKE